MASAEELLHLRQGTSFLLRAGRPRAVIEAVRSEPLLERQRLLLAAEPDVPVRFALDGVSAALDLDEAATAAEMVSAASRRLSSNRGAERFVDMVADADLALLLTLADQQAPWDRTLWHLLAAWHFVDTAERSVAHELLMRLRGARLTFEQAGERSCCDFLLAIVAPASPDMVAALHDGLVGSHGLGVSPQTCLVASALAMQGHEARARALAESAEATLRPQAAAGLQEPLTPAHAVGSANSLINLVAIYLLSAPVQGTLATQTLEAMLSGGEDAGEKNAVDATAALDGGTNGRDEAVRLARSLEGSDRRALIARLRMAELRCEAGDALGAARILGATAEAGSWPPLLIGHLTQFLASIGQRREARELCARALLRISESSELDDSRQWAFAQAVATLMRNSIGDPASLGAAASTALRGNGREDVLIAIAESAGLAVGLAKVFDLGAMHGMIDRIVDAAPPASATEILTLADLVPDPLARAEMLAGVVGANHEKLVDQHELVLDRATAAIADLPPRWADATGFFVAGTAIAGICRGAARSTRARARLASIRGHVAAWCTVDRTSAIRWDGVLTGDPVQDFRRSSAFDSARDEIVAAIGTALVDAGDFDGAHGAIEALWRRHGQSEDVLWRAVAKAHARGGQLRGALHATQQMAYPARAGSMREVGTILATSGLGEHAAMLERELRRQLVEIPPWRRVKGITAMAIAAAESGLHIEAEADFRAATALLDATPASELVEDSSFVEGQDMPVMPYAITAAQARRVIGDEAWRVGLFDLAGDILADTAPDVETLAWLARDAARRRNRHAARAALRLWVAHAGQIRGSHQIGWLLVGMIAACDTEAAIYVLHRLGRAEDSGALINSLAKP